MINTSKSYLSKIIQTPFRGLGGETMSHKVKFICMKVTSVAIFLLFFQVVNSQSRWSELDEALLANQKLLGNNISVMIADKDSLLFKKDLGDFNSKTLAPVASSSKWLTAALVMVLVDEGKLSLDEPVVRYIPEFEKYFKNYITLRHCLSHMTGISDEGGFLKRFFQRKKFNSLEEEVNSFASREIRANPGTDFWYGNIGLNIAGRVIEVVTKRRFDLVIKQRLFNPLAMRRTSFTTMDGSVINPSGGAQSTAEDYMKFLQMLLNKGKVGDKQVLSQESVEELMKLQTAEIKVGYAPESAKGYGYALGSWVIEEGKNGTANALASPGLFGVWPLIDFCRGYAYLVFVKNLLGEERAEAHKELKAIVDKQLPDKCQ